jgi:hypothetical protein
MRKRDRPSPQVLAAAVQWGIALGGTVVALTAPVGPSGWSGGGLLAVSAGAAALALVNGEEGWSRRLLPVTLGVAAAMILAIRVALPVFEGRLAAG